MGRAFDDWIHRTFYSLGLNIHKYRALYFIGSLLFAAVSSYGLVYLKAQTTIDPEFVFSPTNAPWRYERAVLTEHWPLDEQNFIPGKSYDYFGYVDILVAGKVHEPFGRPNILSPKYLDEIYIVNNLTVPVLVNDKEYDVAYTDLCMTSNWKCFLNDHLVMLQPRSKWGNFSTQLADFAKDIILKEVNITYPIAWRGTEPIYFGALVGGPRLIDDEGHFDYASAVRLTYNTRDQKVGNISHLWRQRLTDYLTNKEHPPSDILDIGMFHNESLPTGLQDVADALTPKFAGTVTILFTFCFAVSVVLINHGNGVIAIDWVRSKPMVVTAGLWVPLISIPTAFGLVLWTGELYNAIVNVSPFLVLCIGIDDLFVMSAGWHRTNPEKRPEIRIAETLSDAAVAITITSVTDILTFGIGIFTPLPAVRMFCLYTCLQCVFTYVYQLTFFTPVLSWAADMEDAGIHCLLCCKAIEAKDTNSKLKLHLLAGSVSRKSQRRLREEQRKAFEAPPTPEAPPAEDAEAPPPLPTSPSPDTYHVLPPSPSKEGMQDSPNNNNNNNNESPRKESCLKSATNKIGPDDSSKAKRIVRFLEEKLDHSDNKNLSIDVGEETLVNKLFREVIGPFLLERSTQICAGLLYLVYLLVAIAGCINIREGLNPKFLVREDFYLADFYKLIDETLWQEGLQMQVVVNNPPDLFRDRVGINKLIESFEDTYYTMKHNATMIWLKAFDKYLEDQVEETRTPKPTNSSEWYHRAREWLVIAGGRANWEKDMVWGEGEEHFRLKAFRFQVGLKNYRTPSDHTASCRMMREIAERFAIYNVTTFHEYYPFADQYLTLKPSLFSNIGMGLGMMLVVTLLMIPDWRAACAVVLAILSINIGVLGYMTFWGVNLDSVSMITVIMCIGFAVDLSAHIAYAYSQAHGCPKTRAVIALEELGWPVFLGAFSTVLGIMVLTLVDSYIVLIFFKTVFLVITFSMLHGLLFLPIFLMIAIPETRANEEKKRKISVKFEVPSESSNVEEGGEETPPPSDEAYDELEEEEEKGESGEKKENEEREGKVEEEREKSGEGDGDDGGEEVKADSTTEAAVKAPWKYVPEIDEESDEERSGGEGRKTDGKSTDEKRTEGEAKEEKATGQ